MISLSFAVTFVSSLAVAPLYLSIINKTKAFFAGRQGPPLLQPYIDIWKLLNKGAVYSKTTTSILFVSPVIGLGCLIIATAFLPVGRTPSIFAFDGDFIVLAYLFALMRFFFIIAALDTGSSFEGMGASREAYFATLTEVAFILGLAAMAKKTGTLCLSGMLTQISGEMWKQSGGILALTASSLFIVLLSECARIPIDDPNTHLELTMIHEVMVLDHSGPDFALIHYLSCLKFWIIGSVLVRMVLPATVHSAWLDQAMVFAAVAGIAVAVGLIESSMARLKLNTVPQLLVGASTLSALALLLGLR
ncbi:MAG: NADH-quinone oxidoreductase subunit H [Deltaproteobacteria bacterium]|nr:NADH-quinone oxidoreductase subunit H [Deltaproteobacteria bacterium]